MVRRAAVVRHRPGVAARGRNGRSAIDTQAHHIVHVVLVALHAPDVVAAHVHGYEPVGRLEPEPVGQKLVVASLQGSTGRGTFAEEGAVFHLGVAPVYQKTRLLGAVRLEGPHQCGGEA